MNHKRFAQKAKNWFWIFLFVAYAALAAGVVIDTIRPEFRGLTQVSVISVSSAEEMRSKGASQVAAVYRATSGVPFSSLPPGSTFKIVWPDGSSEEILVGNPASNIAARPLGGTQRPSTE
jgi:molybdopterin-binding protein